MYISIRHTKVQQHNLLSVKLFQHLSQLVGRRIPAVPITK